MQYQSQKDRVISESIQEKKEKEDLLLLIRKISPRPRNQNKKLRNTTNKELLSFDRVYLSQICIFICFKVLWSLL